MDPIEQAQRKRQVLGFASVCSEVLSILAKQPLLFFGGAFLWKVLEESVNGLARLILPDGMGRVVEALLSPFWQAAFGAAIALVAIELVNGRVPQGEDCLRRALDRYPETLVYSIAFSLLIGLGFLLLIAPGVWLQTIFSLWLPITLLGIKEPFKVSMSLVKGAFTEVALLVFAPIVLVFVFFGPFVFFAGNSNAARGWLGVSVGPFVVAWSTVLSVVIYKRLSAVESQTVAS